MRGERESLVWTGEERGREADTEVWVRGEEGKGRRVR